MKHSVIICLVLCYVALSAFLETEFGGRVTVADVFLVLLIGIAFTDALGSGRLHLSRVQLAVVPLLMVFLVGAVGARYVDRASFELLVLTFNVVGAIALTHLLLKLPEIWLSRFFRGYVLVLGALSFICLVDFFIMPGLVSSRQLGGLQGPFRNTGQAGSFFGVHCALATALVMGRVVPRRLIYIGATMLILFALIFTLKRASTLSIVVGIVAFVLLLAVSKSTYDKKTGLSFVLGAGLAGTIGYQLFEKGLDLVPGMRWRFETKFSVETLESFSDGFLAENISSALRAFDDSPLVGVGLGNVMGIYQSHEIHSTYLGVLAYGGLLGVCAYAFFMCVLFVTIYRESRYKLINPWAAFLYMLLPLLLGQMVGWAYTIHIRKREFWILVVFVVAALHLSQATRRRQSFPKRHNAGEIRKNNIVRSV